MSYEKDIEDLLSEENIPIFLLAFVSFIISFFTTICFFIKNCKLFNIFVFFFFNFSMVVISIFPLMSVYDNYYLVMEKIEVYDAKELEPIRTKIKYYFKIMHYLYYGLSDVVIPFFTVLYFKIYIAKKEDGEKYKCFSCSILKGFFFFIINFIIFTIGAIVIVCVLPEPKVDELKENTEGWDGLMFNLRNIESLAEYEYNIILAFFLLAQKGIYYMRWICKYCLKSCVGKDYYDTFLFWKIGKLREEKENVDDDKLSDFDIAQEELQKERNEFLADKLVDYYKDGDKSCNKCFIPKVLYEPIWGFFLCSFGFLVFLSDFYNSFGDISFIDYKNLKSDYEKTEKKEQYKSLIVVDFFIFFVLFIAIFFDVLYAIIEKNYFKEYFPYLGSKHNGIGFLILLKYILRIQLPIYFLVFFPLMGGDYNPVISNYFKLFKFTLDHKYWFLIKTSLIVVVLLFAGCGLTRDGIFRFWKEGKFNKYAKEGAKYCGVSDEDYLPHISTSAIIDSETDSSDNNS